MKLLLDFLSSPLADRIGLTILHSFWQLTLLAVIASLLLECLRRSSSQLRYLLSYGTLVLMLAFPVVTFFILEIQPQTPVHPVETKASSSPLATLPTPTPIQTSPLQESPQLTEALFPKSNQAAPQTASTPSPAPAISPSPQKTPQVAVRKTSPPAPTPTVPWHSKLSQWLTPWHPRIAAAWILGFVFLTLRHAGGWHTTQRLRRTSTRPTDQRLKSLLASLSTQLGIRREVQLQESSFVETPILFGWLKPIILTPVGLLAQLSNDQLEALLAHELAHVRRHDFLFNVLQTVIESLLFYHPATWWISRRIRLEREFHCDDLAVSLQGDRISYAQALANIEESRTHFGSSLAAGEKPLLQRIKRILGLYPQRKNKLTLVGVSGGGLLASLFCSLALFSSAQEPPTEQPESSNENKKGETTPSWTKEQQKAYEKENEQARQQLAADKTLRELGSEIRPLIKAGKTQEVTDKVLTEFLPLNELYLRGDRSTLVESGTKRIAELISEDERILPLLVQKIQTLEQPLQTKAALFDMSGASEQARQAYATILTSEQEYPSAVVTNQIRLLGPHDPSRITALLKDAPDNGKTRNAITSACTSIETFETSIQFIDALSSYLEEVSLPSENNFRWIPQIAWIFDRRVYGEYQMPPLWEPNTRHTKGIKGLPSTTAMHERRYQAFERFCRAVLRLPAQSAWAFSQLSALADQQGKFDQNQDLIDSATIALQASQEVTPLGLFAKDLTGPRFYTPELYLARARWNEQVKLSNFTLPIEARITQLEKLLSADSTQFKADSQALINDSSLEETIYFGNTTHQEKPAAVAARRSQEIMQISQERKQPGESFQLVLDLLMSNGGIASSSLALLKDSFLDQMNAIAKEEGSAKIDQLLEELALAYLGPPEGRAQIIATLPDPNLRISWMSVPPVVQYTDFLKAMIGRPNLASPALKKAEELKIIHMINWYSWNRDNPFLNKASEVIALLDASPMSGNVVQFRSYPRLSGFEFPSSYPSRPTLLGWFLSEIKELEPKTRQPYLDHFKKKNTFGAQLILATFEKESSRALTQVIEAHRDGIKVLPEERKKELALFITPRISDTAAITALFSSAQKDANQERVEQLKKTLMAGPESGLIPSQTLEDLFLPLFQENPDQALNALYLTVVLADQGFPRPQRRSQLLGGSTASIGDKMLEALSFKGQKATTFYLRVLADEQLRSALQVNEQLLSPRFPSDGTKLPEDIEFKKAFTKIVANYPQNLPPEYLFITAIKRHEHVSARGKESTRTPQFFSEVLDPLPPKLRPPIEAGIILGAHSQEWTYRSGKTPGWKDPQVAKAFNQVATFLADEELPMSLRLALAAITCKKCGIHTPPALVEDCAKILVAAWEQNQPVGIQQEEGILETFTKLPTSESKKETTPKIVATHPQRVALLKKTLGREPSLNASNMDWIIGLSASLDPSTVSTELTIDWSELSNSSAQTLLPLLIRNGKTDDALQLIPTLTSSKGNLRSTRDDTFFDQELASHLPKFLNQIKDLEERAVVEAYLHGLETNPFDENTPSREERLIALAQRENPPVFTRPDLQRSYYLLLAQEKGALPFLSDGLVACADIERLPEIIKTSEIYGWVNLAETMIESTLAAQKFNQTLTLLEQIKELIPIESNKTSKIWEKLSSGVSNGVSFHQKDPQALTAMLPVTNFMAALPLDYVSYERTRAGNIARNIFCHALVNRMDHWQKWHASLEPDFRTELDEFWYDNSGWAIGLPTTRIRKDTSLDERLALMKNILSQKEIVGPRGFLHDKALKTLQKDGYFSPAEFSQIKDELAEVIPH